MAAWGRKRGLVQLDRIAFMEGLAFYSDLGLVEACERLARGAGLSPVDFDAENETQWGLVEVDGVEVNVSRPYQPGTLEDSDDTTPPGCNFGVILIVSKGHRSYPADQRAMQHLVP